MDDRNLTGDYQSGKPEESGGRVDTPQHIGRYRIDEVLGKGGFGLVYLAHDEQLQRPVALKVPHPQYVARPENAAVYFTEARTVASLDHPNIVPVFDVGSSAEYPCFIVSKYIDGTDLAAKLKRSRPSQRECVEIVATVAEALHYAHKQGLVHRDVKPGNILLDKSGKPFVGDFGLALREEDVGKGPRHAGTPSYMSPEQARGEGHRVDGRSDIFSLGVVLYELLTGRKPFKAETQYELFDQIANLEARPPRQVDDTVPKELDRICLKSLAKRASERYSTAADMAEDLRLALSSAMLDAPSQPAWNRRDSVTGSSTLTPALVSEVQPIKIVPKGLRSFDAADADFFLELLPGPRDREGLPDSLRFWKSRIESTDPDSTFSVGLLYGPSGCGKSSLVKAGLLPRLAKSITVLYLEATGETTEARLLNAIRKQFPKLDTVDPSDDISRLLRGERLHDADEKLTLPTVVASLRRGRILGSGQKLLIVIDQFEQWLHARRNEENSELVQALRQCDGARLQCLVLVRDDFWMAATRFMRELEISLVEGQNTAAVDLFPIRHAQKVLAAYGRAFGELSQTLDASKEQKQFIEQVVAGLAQDGKVISVRLSLFAEMVKAKPWTPATLREVGGTKGVGATFLEETFAASTAPPSHRLHQNAAQAVLKALLPDEGTNIKGHMQPRQLLLEASGYADRPGDFDELLHILDTELRLITPSDVEGRDAPAKTADGHRERYYQLTHDYLVHSLRDWLTRKQKETRRGRAELLLADRATVWNARPENRQLPSLMQTFTIQILTKPKEWTAPQRAMMGHCRRYHALRVGTLALLLTAITAAGIVTWNRWNEGVVEKQKATYANGLVQSVINADTPQVPGIVQEMAAYRRWTDPLLKQEFDRAPTRSQQKLHAALALLPVDASQVAFLRDQLLEAEPQDVTIIRDALEPHRAELVEKLWTVLEKPEKGKESQRLRAASALAAYDPNDARWSKVQQAVADDLVRVPAVHLAVWMNALRPVRSRLIEPLSHVYADVARRDAERSLATDILADYASDMPMVLADLLMNAEATQFDAIFARLREHGAVGLGFLTSEIDQTLPMDLSSANPRREVLARRQANAAAALIRMDQAAKVWPLLKHSLDPRVRSYLIHRLAPLGVDAEVLLRRFDEETDADIRRALLLSLGEYGDDALPPALKPAFLAKLQSVYQHEIDPGLHAASEWLLRKWEQQPWLDEMNGGWKDPAHRTARLKSAAKQPLWYVNGQGQTMILLPGPDKFVMGSPKDELGRKDDETQHGMTISRTFALAANLVTIEQYRKFKPDYTVKPEKFMRTANLPVVEPVWREAAEYCNWMSKQEGIPQDQWCYVEDENGKVTGMKADYLGLTGYRLPTEAEMEFATRAGAATSRYFGETDELLPKYAWYVKNSQEQTWPVGSLKPNDLGFFDMMGNVYTWCQERYRPYPEGGDTEDREDIPTINDKEYRVLRGGSFYLNASFVRSARRNFYVPTFSYNDNGFRPARTIRP